MARFGLDYETLRARNAALVVASISGFGQSGPYAHRPALDVIVQGMGGMLSITGGPAGGRCAQAQASATSPQRSSRPSLSKRAARA